MNNILISICIPTCNRALLLEPCLRNILSLYSFDDSVQLVIADNASTDNTEDMVAKIITEYPKKNIKYYKQTSNIGLKNWQTCLNIADGIYCKLFNDYTYFDNSTLKLLKEEVQKYSNIDKKKYFLSFIAGVRDWNSDAREIRVQGVNAYILCTNNKLTWVSNFGCFKDQLSELSQYDKYADKMLDTLYWQLHFASSRDYSIIVNISGLSCIPVPPSKRIVTYNFFTPHVVWYYEIINHFTKLTKKEYKFDRTRLITDFVGSSMRSYLIAHNKCAFDLSGSWHILFKYFYDIPQFYKQILKGYCDVIYQLLKKVTIKLGFEDFARKVLNKPKKQ